MPVFNGMPQITTALKSLVEQTYTKWECIIVNDGSTDGTTAFLNSLTDERFKVIHLDKNMGRPYARQKALEASKGEYIAMLDADDFYHSNKILEQVEFMTENKGIDLVSSQMLSFGYRKNFYLVRPLNKYCGKKYICDGESLKAAHGPSMYRHSLVGNNRYNLNLKLGQDLDFLKRILTGKKYFIIPSVHYFYSELDSVTISKIIETYNYKLAESKGKKIRIYLNVKKEMVKFFSLLLGIDFFLKLRGRKANKKEIKYLKNYIK